MPGTNLTAGDLIDVWRRYMRPKPEGYVTVFWPCGTVAFEAPQESVDRFKAAGLVVFEEWEDTNPDGSVRHRTYWYLTFRAEHELRQRGFDDRQVFP